MDQLDTREIAAVPGLQPAIKVDGFESSPADIGRALLMLAAHRLKHMPRHPDPATYATVKAKVERAVVDSRRMLGTTDEGQRLIRAIYLAERRVRR